MRFEEALELMKKGYPVVNNHAIYFIPHNLPKIEENIKFYYIEEDFPFESDIDQFSKDNDDFKKL